MLVWGLGTFWGPGIDDGLIWGRTILVAETPSLPAVGLGGMRSQDQPNCNQRRNNRPHGHPHPARGGGGGDRYQGRAVSISGMGTLISSLRRPQDLLTRQLEEVKGKADHPSQTQSGFRIGGLGLFCKKIFSLGKYYVVVVG